MNNWYNIAQNGNAADIFVYDEIGAWGVSAAQFASDLKALGEVSQINLRINSPGGSIVDGTAIYNLLKSHKARKVVSVDGIAASMASVIAMAGDEIIMPANALMMIHNPWTITMGDAEQLRKDAALLDKMKGQIISAYARSGKSPEEISALMDAETWMDGTEAVAAGFATATAQPLAMAAKLDLSKVSAKIDARAEKLFASQHPEANKTDESEPAPASQTIDDQPHGGATGDFVARHERELEARENIITGLRAEIAGLQTQLTALTAARDDLAGQIAAKTGEAAAAATARDNYKARLEKLLGGIAFTPEGANESWQELVAKHGYEKARAQFPPHWKAWMKSKGINLK